MTTKKAKFRSRAAEAAHETIAGLHRIGAVEKTTMREFDDSCLTKVEALSPAMIKTIRTKAGVSQGVFAQHLNVRATVVSQWERGERRPTGTAQKLLALAKRKGLKAIM